MNTGELSLLLARMSVVDGRDVDQLTIEAWEPLIGDLDYRDAVEGLNAAYRVLTRRPTPADIREAANTARGARERRDHREIERARRDSGQCVPHTWHYISMSKFMDPAYKPKLSEPPVCTGHHFHGKGEFTACEYCGDRPHMVGHIAAQAVEEQSA